MKLNYYANIIIMPIVYCNHVAVKIIIIIISENHMVYLQMWSNYNNCFHFVVHSLGCGDLDGLNECSICQVLLLQPRVQLPRRHQ